MKITIEIDGEEPMIIDNIKDLFVSTLTEDKMLIGKCNASRQFIDYAIAELHYRIAKADLVDCVKEKS